MLRIARRARSRSWIIWSILLSSGIKLRPTRIKWWCQSVWALKRRESLVIIFTWGNWGCVRKTDFMRWRILVRLRLLARSLRIGKRTVLWLRWRLSRWYKLDIWQIGAGVNCYDGNWTSVRRGNFNKVRTAFHLSGSRRSWLASCKGIGAVSFSYDSRRVWYTSVRRKYWIIYENTRVWSRSVRSTWI